MAKRKVTFKFKAPGDVHAVKLCANFTNWEQGCIVMNKGNAGEWKTQVNLERGDYEYKFMADGRWFTDPSADRQVHNPMGTDNSVRHIS